MRCNYRNYVVIRTIDNHHHHHHHHQFHTHSSFSLHMRNLLVDSHSVSKLQNSPLLNLKTGDTLGIVGDGSNYRNYTNILMTRLSIRSLFSRRLGGVGSP